MKKLTSLLLALALSLSLMLPALAADTAPFPDVPADAWYAEAVAALKERGLAEGFNLETFGPEEDLNRAMLCVLLYRIAGSPAVTGEDAFTDTAADAWYSDAVLWASQKGVVKGYGDGTFRPEATLTQQQMITMVWRDAGGRVLNREKYASSEGIEGTASAWAFDAVVWAKVEALIYDQDAFRAAEAASRAQCADFLWRYITNVVENP